jgi:hypothetical protein
MTLPYTRSEIKDRARADWAGLTNVTLPSFTEDFTALNEDGIRHDVRLAAEHGYWGTLVAAESGTTMDEYCRFLEVAAEAAPEGFKIVAHLSFSTVEESLRAAKVAEGVGAEAGLLSYPPSFRPRSSADIVEHTRYVAEHTDLALILFGVTTWGFKPLHPSGFPLDALAQMAKLDTAAALKYEALRDRPPRFLAAAAAGDFESCMEIFWSCQPAREAKGAFHATFGGALRGGIQAAGFDVPDDDAEFYAGRL